MRKTLLVMAIAALGSTAYAAPYYMPNPSYTPGTGTPIPDYAAPRGYDYDAKSAPLNSSIQEGSSTFAIEIGPNYTLMTDSLDEDIDKIDTIGADITAVYNLSKNWAITLRGSWATGSDTLFNIMDIDVTNWSIAPGIRYTLGITDNLSAFAGVNIGYGDSDVDTEIKGLGLRESLSDSGLVYGIELGLKYDINDSLYLYGAAQYWGTTAEPDQAGAKLDKQAGFNFRLGMGYEF